MVVFEAIEASLFSITALLVARRDRMATPATPFTPTSSSSGRNMSVIFETGTNDDKDLEEAENVAASLPCEGVCACSGLDRSMQRKQAYLVSGIMVRQLLQQLCRAPLKLFTAPMVELVISCWYWLLSARSSLKLQVGRVHLLNFYLNWSVCVILSRCCLIINCLHICFIWNTDWNFFSCGFFRPPPHSKTGIDEGLRRRQQFALFSIASCGIFFLPQTVEKPLASRHVVKHSLPISDHGT